MGTILCGAAKGRKVKTTFLVTLLLVALICLGVLGPSSAAYGQKTNTAIEMP
jgi:hypothetical protein